ncbi:signal recognition particle, SRP19 subunit [Chaetomidium leptoderma]|uniref:Signal recognition particle, SRP19 subunit n=1 Tax=Chaetomidium leptoderma TaxID=669021 RepID=A0AAN6ZYP3_9PEZI|nr:signal recognition particle, SRP19 subunit [Chaetomidium leptoderma]
MSHPRVEEVSDSDDVDMSDPSEDDIDDFMDSDIIRRVDNTQQQQQQPSQSRPTQQQQAQPLPHRPAPAATGGFPQMQTTTDEKAYKSFQCLYPVYFDATRTRAQGRRVPRTLAVANPLAIEIVQACANLRLQTVLEAGKLHPKDWANPGRVKVNLRQATPQTPQTVVNNKHHLYLLVAKHLRANPTTDQSRSLRMEVRGAPMPPAAQEPGKPWPRPAVPRGWKMGELLPYYSPAMTGGGVSENFLKDMMKEMQQAGGGAGGAGGMPDMASLLAAAGGGGGGAGAASGSGAGGGGGKKDKKGKGK